MMFSNWTIYCISSPLVIWITNCRELLNIIILPNIIFLYYFHSKWNYQKVLSNSISTTSIRVYSHSKMSDDPSSLILPRVTTNIGTTNETPQCVTTNISTNNTFTVSQSQISIPPSIEKRYHSNRDNDNDLSESDSSLSLNNTANHNPRKIPGLVLLYHEHTENYLLQPYCLPVSTTFSTSQDICKFNRRQQYKKRFSYLLVVRRSLR